MAPSSAIRMGTLAQSASSIIMDAVVEGSHVLKIEGYSRAIGLSNGKYIKCRTFQVGGHSWYIRYYPDGDCAKNAGWISLYLQLENSSATEVKAKFRFSLLDEMGEPVPPYSKIWSSLHDFKKAAAGAWGYQKFIERKTLAELPYMKDDCFSVRCDVVVCKGFRTEDTKKFVTVPPPDMQQDIGRLLVSQVEADVTFQIGAETITAHRLVLAARSPVFMAQLFGPMKEKSTHHIQIDDMEGPVFKAMLHYMYTDSLPEVDKDEEQVMAQHLLVAADRYDLERLKQMCGDKLCNYINTSTVATTLALAEQHGCHGLKEACFEFLTLPGNLKAIMSSDGFEHLISSCPCFLKEMVGKLAP